MKITSIAIDGFKGGNVALDLSSPVLLAAPNGAGKSRVMEALAWCLTGRVAWGKSLDEVAKQFGPRGGGVRIELEDGAWMERELVRDHEKAKNSSEESYSEGDADKFAVVDEVLLMGEFLALSAQKRREFVLELCGAGELDRAKLTAIIAKNYAIEACGPLGKLEHLTKFDATAELPEEMAALCDLWSAKRGILEELQAGLVGKTETASQACQRLVDLAKERKNRAHASAAEAKSAMRELEAGLEGYRAAAAMLTRLTGELKAAEGVAAQVREIEAGRREALRARDDAKATLERTVEANEAAKKKLAETPDPGPEPVAPDSSAYHAKMAGITVEARRLGEERGRADAALRAVEKAKRDVQEAEAIVKACLSSLEANEALPMARLARAVERGAEHILRMAPVLTPETAVDLEEFVAAARVACDDWRQSNIRMKGLVDIQRDALDDDRLALAAAEAAATKITPGSATLDELESQRTDLQSLRNSAIAVYQSACQAWRRKKTAHDRALHAAETAAVAEGEARDRLQRAEERLSSFPETGIAFFDDEKLKALRQARDAAQEANGAVQAYEDASERAKRETLAWEAWKRVERAVASAREEYVAEVTRPILVELAEVLKSCGRSEAPYLELENDRGKPIFELGWSDGTKRVALEALSGGEAAVFVAALAVVLSRRAGGLRIVLLEADPLDDDRFLDALAGLAQLETDCTIVATAKYDRATELERWVVYGEADLAGAQKAEVRK